MPAAFEKTGNFTAQTAAALKIEVNGTVHDIAAETAITMPATAVAGTDYIIWVHPDGTLEATDSYTTPPVANARRVGGFHYAPGSNASAQAGGNTTAQINEYSFWDLKWRPACEDPRGMTLVAGKFWCDIYLLNVDHHVNGTSVNDATIADDGDPPKIPAMFGGNGSSVYSDGNWWNLVEVLASHGKRPPSYQEFCALAYGVTEVQSRGNDPVTTGFATTNAASSNGDEEFTSKWGVIQAAGVMWLWANDFGRGGNEDSWSANTQGRGSTYGLSRVALLGGDWNRDSDAGSRCSVWNTMPTGTGTSFGARGCCDHLNLG